MSTFIRDVRDFLDGYDRGKHTFRGKPGPKWLAKHAQKIEEESPNRLPSDETQSQWRLFPLFRTPK